MSNSGDNLIKFSKTHGRNFTFVMITPTGQLQSVGFSDNSKFSAKSWQHSASIDIQWLQPIVCQCWQNSAMIWRKITKYRKTRLSYNRISIKKVGALIAIDTGYPYKIQIFYSKPLYFCIFT